LDCASISNIFVLASIGAMTILQTSLKPVRSVIFAKAEPDRHRSAK
jgi:hypothetical protein